MTFSRLLFLAAFALLTLASCNAWGVIQGLRQTRPHKASDILKVFLALLCVASLCSCSTQVVTRPNGDRLVNNNLLSKGRIEQRPDGSFVMAGNAEKAADKLAGYGGALIKAGLITRGVEAVQSVSNNAVDSIK